MTKELGRVVRLRLHPKDCMGIVDVIRRLGLGNERYSFDQATRIALSALLQTVKNDGLIPDRDGFDYLEMMGPYAARSKQEVEEGKQLALSLNKNMTNESEPDAIPDARISQLLKEQDTILERCMLDPYNHPDNEDILEYARLSSQILLAQGDTTTTDQELEAAARQTLPPRK